MMQEKKSKTILTKEEKETKKEAKSLAKDILTLKKGPIVIALTGDLGAGKTAFVQGLAEGLKIQEKITSPTFVILKKFKIKDNFFKFFYHIDCYRLESSKEILDLGWKDFSSQKENIIAVEWPERIRDILPKDAWEIKFKILLQDNRELWIKKS